jgi:hypothetical protein
MFNVGRFISKVNAIESSPPSNRIQFANDWSDAFMGAFGTPSPPSLTALPARGSMFTMFLLAYGNNDNGKTIMNTGVSMFAAQMAPGMLPLFAAIPPVGYQGFTQVNIDGTTTIGILGPSLAAVTLPWFMTGTAVNVASGVTIPWS